MPSRMVRQICWSELYKAAVRIYTKPLFDWRKALCASSDGKTLYDFARFGLKNLEAIHKALLRKEFRFRPALTPKECQVVGYHRKNGTTSPLYESIRRKYPNL